MTYASADDPPFFIQHGTADCSVPTGQSQILQDLFQGSGHDSAILLLTGAGHGGPEFVTESNLQQIDAFWNAKLRQPVNPLINTVRIFRKSSEVSSFRAGSLGQFYRIAISGINLTSDTKVLINGSQRGVSVTGMNEITVFGSIGRIPASGQVEIQVKNSAGRFSNVFRAPVAAK
jgi:hypothetical protein